MRYDLDDWSMIGERAVVAAVVVGWLALSVIHLWDAPAGEE